MSAISGSGMGKPCGHVVGRWRATNSRSSTSCGRSCSIEPGDQAVVAVPGSTDPEIVAFLDTLGLRPGVHVEIVEKHPFDGPLVMRVDGHERTVGQRLAEQIYVRKLDPSSEAETRREQTA